MKIAYLGAGSWGFCLASLLAKKNHEVIVWTVSEALKDRLNHGGDHPNLPGHTSPSTLRLTSDLQEALQDADVIVESVTSSGIRPVFEQVQKLGFSGPIVLTSKGIEQNTGLLLSDVVLSILGEKARSQVGCISGPSHAEEVVKGLPASVVCSAYSPEVMTFIHELFATNSFRVYPNSDINGVEFGGAVKNIIAIACGISDGLGFGDNAKAALMTRGLHEIRKLAVVKGCRPETLNGLAGMGDLCVTCLSTLSRNYRFGQCIAKGMTMEEAKSSIGMVVEGAYSCVSTLQLAQKAKIAVPITEAVYQILYEKKSCAEAVKELMRRTIKEEHL